MEDKDTGYCSVLPGYRIERIGLLISCLAPHRGGHVLRTRYRYQAISSTKAKDLLHVAPKGTGLRGNGYVVRAAARNVTRQNFTHLIRGIEKQLFLSFPGEPIV